MNIPISAIDFGRIDAKREFLTINSEKASALSRSFTRPPNFSLDEFRAGRRCFITGLKGTGKTALLYHIQQEIKKSANNITDFILFQSEFSEDDRRLLSVSVGFNLAEDDRGKTGIEQDFENSWVLFLAQLLCKKLFDLPEYKNNANSLKKFVDFVKSLKFSRSTHAPRLIPQLKNGRIEIGADFEGFVAKYSGDVEIDKNRKSISVSDSVRFILDIMPNISMSGVSLSIFIDELELPYGNSAAFERDARLIRDMVVTVTRFNDSFSRQGIPIRFIVAVRSEVLKSVSALGKEIYKSVEDLGFKVDWSEKMQDGAHPLLDVVANRIRASEEDHGLSGNSDWISYFPNEIGYDEIRTFLLHSGWYRPRDMVRLLTGAQKRAGDRTSFIDRDFEDSLKDYSSNAWIEHTEELQAGYSIDQIRAAKRIFQAIRRRFSLGDFVSICNQKSAIHPDVTALLLKKSPNDILDDFYRVGLIGNFYFEETDVRSSRSEASQRWAFRGDIDLDPDKDMTVHRALWRELSIR